MVIKAIYHAKRKLFLKYTMSYESLLWSYISFWLGSLAGDVTVLLFCFCLHTNNMIVVKSIKNFIPKYGINETSLLQILTCQL